jgi:predicted dehydrogenase
MSEMRFKGTIHWGMIGCGDVAEIKSGPAFQKAEGSELVAVMRRDRARAEDFARRHRVPVVHSDASSLIDDPAVDAVYIATPPSSHCELALRVAAAGKPCLVEKPMAMNHGECLRMVDAFRNTDRPLWVAYYRRALARFLKVRDLLAEGAIGILTSITIDVRSRLATGERAGQWRLDPSIAGGGLFFDLGSHCFDLIDFLVGPVSTVHGFSVNTGGAYPPEDVTAAVFQLNHALVGSGVWNFNAPSKADFITFTGSGGELKTPIFTDGDVSIIAHDKEQILPFRNPPHVHQPLIQTIVDELHGNGECPSTGVSGARTSSVLDRCVANYYGKRDVASRTGV